MDPTANLARQLVKARQILASNGDVDPADARDLAELVQNLHERIYNGGFLPKQWTPLSTRKSV